MHVYQLMERSKGKKTDACRGGRGRGLRICISIQLPGDANAVRTEKLMDWMPHLVKTHENPGK